MTFEAWALLALFALIVYSDIRNWSERKNLLDRIMARDFADFASRDPEHLRAERKGKPVEAHTKIEI